MIIKSTSIKTWARLGQRGTFFGIAMPEIAKEKENLKLLTADLALLSGMDRFIANYPEKFLNIGIAEQNMIGIAAGFAMEGRCVFATTYASFIAVRSLEQIRQHLSYLQCNIKIIGTAAGVMAARSGISHCATEDLAFMRVLPNIIVLSPADSLEAYKMAHFAAETDLPIYIRLSGGLNCPVVHNDDFSFEVGKALILKKGSDVAIIATGLMVSETLKAAKILDDWGISCSVIEMHTIKPLDKDTLNRVFAEHKLIISVEEHSVLGGLGSAIAEYKATLKNTPRQIFIGFPDLFAEAGGQRYIWERNGLTAEHISERIISELE